MFESGVHWLKSHRSLYNFSLFTQLSSCIGSELTVAQPKKRLFGPVHNAPEKFENATITGHFGFVFEEDWDKEITRGYRDVIVSAAP